MKFIKNYIDGQLIGPILDEHLENIDPSRGKVYSMIPDSTSDDVEIAVTAAENAFETWSNTPKTDRAAIMIKIADIIESRLDEFAAAESLDNGKPLKIATIVDIPRAVSNLKFFATAIQHYASESHYMEGLGVNYTIRRPIGIVGCISPWNLPLYLFTWKIAPAIAAGNCVIAKPSEITPMTAFLLAEVCAEAGLPNGVLNIIHGLGHKVGDAMTKHPKIKAISFTGGTNTGATIAKIAAPMFKKMSLELGGKNPNIIFADCDLGEAISTTIRSSFANQGQICLCGSRIFIERPIYEEFKKHFVAATEKSKVSFPTDPDAKLGAIVSKSHLEKVLSYVELAKQEGGTILAGGMQVNLEGEYADGYYMRPTIIEGLSYDCRTNQEEIFGPVVTITPFDTEDEVLMMANSTDYGLAATVWTENLKKAHRVADQLQSGIIWVNSWLVRDLRTPFGGMKNSGVGREGGFEALRFFTEPKNVFIKS
jgi:aminomuconate-semialdehyde/2-hydroxymuconate-6-semialdehyde dehydrogenase